MAAVNHVCVCFCLDDGSVRILNRATVSVFVIIAARFLGAAVSVAEMIAARFLWAAISVAEMIAARFLWAAISVSVMIAARFLWAAVSVAEMIAARFLWAAISVSVMIAARFLWAAISVSVMIATRFLWAAISVAEMIAARFLGAAVSVAVMIAARFLGAAVSVSVSEMIISSQRRLAVGLNTAFKNCSHGHFLGLGGEGRSLLRPGDATSIGTGLPFKTQRRSGVIIAALAFEGLAVALLALGVWFRKFSHFLMIEE
jgi:hypothetical protein